MWPGVGWGLLLILASWSEVARGQELSRHELADSRSLLRHERPAYRNFAISNFTQYPNHSVPYTDASQAHYGPLGSYLTTGYDLYSWSETRQHGQEWGSSIFKDFDGVMVARDGHGRWGYSAIVGDALLARFTPLTLSMANFNGLRLDVAVPYLKLTALGSRVERPHHRILFGGTAPWNSAATRTQFADDSTLLLGSRALVELGSLQLGLNWVNQHVYHSTRPGNNLQGVLRPDQPLVDWIIVRFADDSPEDGVGGAMVQEIQLIVNGQPRPELEPRVIRHLAAASPQVGRVSQSTGRFRSTDYNVARSNGRYENITTYRQREIPLYADYFYRLDHTAGEDVSKDTNLDGLLESFDLVSPEQVLAANGEEQIVFLFDVARQVVVESVEVEALLSNDYRVEVATLSTTAPRAKGYVKKFQSTFYHTALRAHGNVQDGSNLKRRRFDIGEHTGHFVYSADLQLHLPTWEIQGEYARSAVYGRYPASREGTPLFSSSPRFAEQGAAYFLNATRRFGWGLLGGEYFSIHPDFQTEMRTFVGFEEGLQDGNLGGMANQTVYWQTVEDNDDGDRYPDQFLGLVGVPQGTEQNFYIHGHDPDGVFVGRDENQDGTPDTNRNLNGLPDYEEAFLLYDVEPDDYVYGLDRNHNDEPDEREGDAEVDYPYDYDQQGYHLFAQWNLSRHGSVGVGRYAVEQVAGAGRNHSSYMLLTYRRRGLGRLRQIFLENNLRRVRDDIADETVGTRELPFRDTDAASAFNLAVAELAFFKPFFQPDPMRYQDSYINETYLETRLRPWSTVNLVQKLRLRLNWQQGGRLRPGLFQRSRRLDFLTWVSRADYTWHWGKLSVTPQYKVMFLRQIDRSQDLTLRSEWRSIPILRLRYPLLPRTLLQVGLQGLGPLPYRLVDQASGHESFEQRTAFFTVTNRTRYLGYDLVTIVGFTRDKKEFDESFQSFRERDGWSLFAKALVGFIEYGTLF